ncbi:late competence development ComFB family protein [Spirochaeta africana]|uniref:Late competence development protein ComFB n=1 Tax=Spirochaeta africana (strain ATCC 700263 / DSM 8902 / Z-7692) TaxID=889378 RepID=H9UKK0_SPIAZ|nr:late competence development ComFB family protein [Spirochaeta africana]AFG38043.1 Late competence development protein ComFB [Spirochaeta africana DSM 8902]
MGLKELLQLEDLVNESERFVLEELEQQLETAADACRTTECVLDMAAYALNKVPPRYRVNLLGRLFSSVPDADYQTAVQQAVSEAIRIVSKNPPRS